MFDDINRKDLESENQELEEKLFQREKQLIALTDLNAEYVKNCKELTKALKEYVNEHGDEIIKRLEKENDIELDMELGNID